MKRNEDNKGYYRFTGPQRLDQAIHTLEGILLGITADDKVTDDEMQALTLWITTNQEFADRHPFNEILPRLYQLGKVGVIDEEERADILWLCNKLKTDDNFYSAITADMQRLHGILGGIYSDGKITAEELKSLQDWMSRHEHLRSCWPYDELDALITSVLADGVIDEDEHRCLLTFFGEFTKVDGRCAIEPPEIEVPELVGGVCALVQTWNFLIELFVLLAHVSGVVVARSPR
jgi:hypothetical protein